MGLLSDDSSIDIKVKANLLDFKKDLNSAKIYARDTKKLLDKELLLELELRRDRFKVELQKAKQDLKKFSLEGNEKMRLKASIRVDELQRSLTESKRHLNNYVNTGEKSLSRLQMKFNGLKKLVSSGLGFLGITFGVQKLTQVVGEMGEVFRNYETAFAGFRKTLNGTEQELKGVEKGIVNMSKRIPKSVEDLSRIAEVGGQMGIATKDILKFTETTAMLSTAIDGISVDEAVQIMSRLQDQTGETTDQLINQANALVFLGNNYKANEGEILNFANEIKGLGGILDLSSADILAMSAVFVDAGINAEAGGTQISKAAITIETAVKTGADSLGLFAEVSSKTIEQFKKDWNKDSASAFTDLLIGMKNSGDSIIPIMQELFGSNARTAKAFLSVANNADKLKIALEQARGEFEDGTAMVDEFNKRLQTTDSQLLLNENRWKAWYLGTGKSISGVRLAFSNFALKFIPNAWATIQFAFAGGYSFLKKVFLSLEGVIVGVGGSIGMVFGGIIDSFNWAVKNASIAGYNLGQAFSDFPGAISTFLNYGIKKIEDFINFVGGGVKKLGKIFGVDMSGFGNIYLGRVDTSGVKGQFKEFENYQATYYNRAKDYTKKYILQNGRKIKIEEEALRQTALRLTKQAELADKGRKETIRATEQEIKEIIKKEQEGNLKRIKELENFLNKQDKLNKGSGKGKSKLEKEKAEELKKLKEKQKELIKLQKEEIKLEKEKNKSIKKGQGLVQKYYDNVTDGAEKSKKKLEKFKEKIKDINDELKDTKDKISSLGSDKDKDLAERRLEIENRIKEINKEIAENIKDGEKDAVKIEEKKKQLQKEINILKQKETEFTDKTKQSTKDSLKYQLEKKQAQLNSLKDGGVDNSELTGELSDLEKELKLNKQIGNEDIYKQKLEESKKTKSELILQEYEKDKKELESKKLKLEEELKLKQDQAIKEEEIYKKVNIIRKKLEENFTGFLKIETDKQLSLIDRLRQEGFGVIKGLKGLRVNDIETLNKGPQSVKKITNNLNINLKGLQVRNDDDIEKISDKVYSKIQNEVELGNKNIY